MFVVKDGARLKHWGDVGRRRRRPQIPELVEEAGGASA